MESAGLGGRGEVAGECQGRRATPNPGPRAKGKRLSGQQGWQRRQPGTQGTARDTGHGSAPQVTHGHKDGRHRDRAQWGGGGEWRGGSRCPVPSGTRRADKGSRCGGTRCHQPAAPGRATGPVPSSSGWGHRGTSCFRGVSVTCKPSLACGTGTLGPPAAPWGSLSQCQPEAQPGPGLHPSTSAPCREGRGQGAGCGRRSWGHSECCAHSPAPRRADPLCPPPGSTQPLVGRGSQDGGGSAERCLPGGAGCRPVPSLPLTSRLYLATTLPMELVAVQT